MKNKFILFFLIIIGNLFVGYITETYAQAFAISEVQAEFFSIDRYANDVYYIDRFTGEVLKRNIPAWIASKTDFITMPEFANKSWKAVFAKDTSIFITDFENDSTWVLIDSAGFYREGSHPGYRFSPNDLFLWYRDNLYSFRDNISYKVETPYPITEQVWSSDSTLIMAGSDVRKFTEYNFLNAEVDTFLVLNEYKEITTYSYNVSRNILAYSLYPNRTEEYIPKIYLYNRETKETVIAFNPLMDDSAEVASCWSSRVGISSLNWSEDETKLAFFSFGLTNSFSGVYIYDLDLDTTYRYTECEDYGLKYELDWYNKDTLVYVDYSTVQVFGFDATSPITSVQEIQNNERYNSEIVIKTYPNPFNDSINIEIVGNIVQPELTIYDINGRRVKTFGEIKTLNGEKQIEWRGRNNHGHYVASGIYFIVVSNNQGMNVSKKINFLK